jgi:ubiquitin carboxyl-terminal hydrolase 4/11/15
MKDEFKGPQKRPLPLSPSSPLEQFDQLKSRSLSEFANSNGGEGMGIALLSQPKGLNNLGNTCFMNSALQCLSATVPLTKYFLGQGWRGEINTTNPLGSGGAFAEVFAALISNLWHNDQHSALMPREFKYMIGMKNPLFVGYGQQDSQELAIFLLDGLHEDLNRIANPGYVQDPEFNSTMAVNEFAKLCWTAYLKRNDSIIVDLFQGTIILLRKDY